ncbi:MAG: hypothetical protein JXP34_17815, partial [Planctomycetes bacterium]|nr:hypothetical protein [Planctomycetota bacterium]
EDVAPWVAADIGDPSWSGGARLEGDELHVCAAGAGFKTGGDEAFFVYQQIEGDFRITARVTDMDAGTSGQRAGVMIRDSLEPNARMATALVQAAANPEARRNRLNYRKNAGSSLGTLTLSPTVTGAEIRVRLERQGLEKVIASASSDGVTWSSVEVPFDSPLPPTLFVGIAACNGSPPATGSYATLGATLAVDLDTTPAVRFKRGDANGDGDTQISDPVFTLMYIFSDGPEPTCVKTADVNDDGSLDLGDPIYGLNYLFVSGPAPLAPFPGCGADPTEDDLSCEAYSPCQ